MKMHEDEVHTDVALVRRLLAAQFPRWADLPIEPVLPWGTDNALYRLGGDMLVRLPRIHWAVDNVQREQEWLPRLAPLLPVAIPVPLAKGEPAEGYPWPWSVYTWLEGKNPDVDRLEDPERFGTELAEFVAALRRIDPTGAPRAHRGAPLKERDAATRSAIDALEATIDTAAVTAAWDEALRAPEWQREPVWIHGDLDSRNLLVQDGRLSGVIDFGGVGLGDPACDVMVAWKVSVEIHDVLRAELPVDEETWARSRGWALSQALMALSYYTLETNAVLVREAQRWMAEVLADDPQM